MSKVLVYQASSRSGHYITNRQQPRVTPIRVFHRSTGYYLKIRVNGKEVQTVNPITKNWPKFDPDPRNCTGHGHTRCMAEGEHSFFNHSMDSYYDPRNVHLSNLPPGYVEEA